MHLAVASPTSVSTSCSHASWMWRAKAQAWLALASLLQQLDQEATEDGVGEPLDLRLLSHATHRAQHPCGPVHGLEGLGGSAAWPWCSGLDELLELVLRMLCCLQDLADVHGQEFPLCCEWQLDIRGIHHLQTCLYVAHLLGAR